MFCRQELSRLFVVAISENGVAKISFNKIEPSY